MNTHNYLNNPYIAAELLEEGFFDSFKQGYKTQFDQSSKSNDQDINFDKYAQKALPAIRKAQQIAQGYSDKLGIPLTLATTLIAAGIVGGPAAVPFAALTYFVRKPVNKLASAAFDKGAEKLGWMPPKSVSSVAQPTSTQMRRSNNLWLPGMNQQKTTGPLWVPNNDAYDYSFSSYLELREFQEGWVTDIKNWWQQKGADQVGEKLGQATGYVTGKTTKIVGNISNAVSGSWPHLVKFVSENKLQLAKAAFLMAVGLAVGAAVGGAVNYGKSALQGLHQSGKLPTEQLQQLSQTVGVQDAVGAKTQAAHGANIQIGDGWNDKLGNWTANRDASGEILYHSQDGSTYKDVTKLGGAKIAPGRLYQKLDPATGEWKRAAITDYMKNGGGGWRASQ